MAVLETFLAERPPLNREENGTVRVGDTRVTLETVLGAWQDGETPEQIQQQYPALNLGDVYAAVSYYLAHQTEVTDYLSRRQQQAAEVRRQTEERCPPALLHARLLARREQ